jgi:hypothetical protein
MLMSRSAFGGSLLVLEGDEDAKFWKTRTTSPSACQLVLAGNKRTAVGSVVKIYALNQTGVLAIVDDDYDSVLGLPLPSANIICTGTCDIEALMLRSTALESLLRELGNDTKISQIEQMEGRTIREAFLSRALIFGQLRYLNALNNWNVSFERMSPYRFVDPSTWVVQRAAILLEICRQVPRLLVAELENHLASLEAYDLWSLLHGKDSLSVLAVGLRSAIGNCQHPIDRLSMMLRLAFNSAMFQGTSLHCNVRTWETANLPFKVLSS